MLIRMAQFKSRRLPRLDRARYQDQSRFRLVVRTPGCGPGNARFDSGRRDQFGSEAQVDQRRLPNPEAPGSRPLSRQERRGHLNMQGEAAIRCFVSVCSQ